MALYVTRRGFAIFTIIPALILLAELLATSRWIGLVPAAPTWPPHASYLGNSFIRDFQRDWLRHRRTLVDWERLIHACVGQEEWGSTKPGWGKENRTSAANSTIAQWDIRPAGEYSKFLIQSRTGDGRIKNIGGDSWRVYLRGPASLAATVFDCGNGTYEVLFLLLEPGIYRVLIYLDYSLCDGYKDPPKEWFIAGESWNDPRNTCPMKHCHL